MGKAAKEVDSFLAEYKTAVFEIQWPNLKLSGKYQRAEEKDESYGLGGEGKLSVEFAPLLGLTGKLDLMQYLLMTLGAPLGPFLRKVSKMSMGKKNPDGSLDKTKSYVETNLELWLGMTTNVGGVASFDVLKGGWKGVEGSGVTGFVGFIFEGKAKIDGKVWRVTFGAGAEFKTTDESGDKKCGIEVSFKTVAIDNKLAIAGLTEFTGLAIAWALYANAGAEGESTSEDTKVKKRSSRGRTKLNHEIKESDRHVLMKKKTLLGGSKPTKIGG